MNAFPRIAPASALLVLPARTRSPRQIRQGAPADVFASANTTTARQLLREDSSLLEAGRLHAEHGSCSIVPTSNPAGIHSVYDLKQPGVKLGDRRAGVPVGSYTLQVLKQHGR